MADPVEVDPIITPVVIGLTTTPTVWGVPYMSIVIIVGGTMIAWLVVSSIWAFLIAPALYMVLFTLCAWDARILDVLQVVSTKTPKTRNRVFWGANSYGP